MGTRGRVDTSPAAQGCPRGLKLRVQYESHTLLQLMILISELIFPFGREIDLVGLQIPAPEANIPGVQSQIKILLSFLERFFRA